MTFRIREAQQDALAMSHVGHFFADLARPVAKVAYYDSLQQCVRVVGAHDQETRIHLDSQGKLLRFVTPLERELRFQYERERPVGTQLPTGLTIRTQYDAQGRVIAEVRNDGAWHQLGYDAHGNLAALRCADGSTLQLNYHEDGRLAQVRERDGGEVRRAYDEGGRLARVIDPLGRETTFAYELWSEPARIETPDGHALSYIYRGNEAQERVDGAEHAEYTFDENGRLAETNYADGYTFKLEYDDAGRLTSATSPDAEVRYEYDRAGRMVSDTQDGRTVRLSYDEDGQLSEITLPDGRGIAYRYDLDGRLASVRDWSGATQRFHYGAAELPVHRELPNGLVESYRLDLAGRITATDLHNRRDVFWSQRYGRDALGRVVAQADSRTGKRSLRYDACGRLQQVIDESTGSPVEWYAYDAAGQRLQSLKGVTRFDAMCRPVQDGGASYSYDALGNRAEKTAGPGTARFSWTGPNLLREVDLPDGTLVRYFYDALGRRVRKEIGETRVTFIWAGHHLVQELHETPTGSYTVEYLYFPGSHKLLAKCEAGQTYYYHCDQLGTPQFLTDRAARLVWSARYETFGTAEIEHNFVAQPWRLPGQYWDAETGLHYNRARYYDPALGVYLSRDPASPIGENAYLYVGANPVNVADPLGLLWQDAPGWVKTAATIGTGIAVGAAVGLAVFAAAPALGIAAGVGMVAILAGGAAGGAAAGALNAAMTEGGCIPCGALKGSIVGLAAATPFVLLPEAAGIAAFAGAGMASGAIAYFLDMGLSGGQFDWGDFGTAVALGGVLGAAGKYVAARFGKGKSPGGTPEEPSSAIPNKVGGVETPAEVARRLLDVNKGSVTKSLQEINGMKLGQDRAINVLQGMYEGSGRGTGGVHTLPDGSKALMSRRIGPGQSILVVDNEGVVRAATGTIEPTGDLTNPLRVVDIEF